MSAYEKCFDGTKYMYLLIKHDEILEKYNEISEIVSKKNLIVNLRTSKKT